MTESLSQLPDAVNPMPTSLTLLGPDRPQQSQAELRSCECGCGLPAPIATRTDSRRGHIKGQPVRFISGHNAFCQIKHGHARHRRDARPTPEYISFDNAKNRCANPHHKHWKDYGGRGIKFLFVSFEQFFAELGPRPEGMTLDRKNNDGNYEPGNVRWATPEQQRANQR
jgi:hypothetical protein